MVDLAALVHKLVRRNDIAVEYRVSERTVLRWERRGLPVIKLGLSPLYDPVRCRAWVMSHERLQDAPKRGRPRKQAA